MIPAQTVNGLAWASRCGHPACHATFLSRPGDTRREAEKRANGRGWKFTAAPLCPLHARQYAHGKRGRS
jgi:hypothetical protein